MTWLKEIQRQVDTSIEEIPHEVSLWNTPDNKERFQYGNISDFMLGYEYGHSGIINNILATRYM
jgi:spore germination protein GerM